MNALQDQVVHRERQYGSEGAEMKGHVAPRESKKERTHHMLPSKCSGKSEALISQIERPAPLRAVSLKYSAGSSTLHSSTT